MRRFVYSAHLIVGALVFPANVWMNETMSIDSDDKGSIGVLARAGMILRTLGSAPTGMSLGQIAKQIGLPRSTVQRLVSGLEAEGLVEVGATAAQIKLGSEFLRLAQISRPSLLDRLHPVMVDLAAETGETADLSMVRRTELFFVDQVVGTERLLAVSHVGDTFPLHCTSVGKAYLASQPRDVVERLIGATYPRRTPNTHITFDALQNNLDAIRATGIGIDLEEHSPGIAAIGISFEDKPGEWFGLSVPLPMQRFEEKRALVMRRLLEIKAQLGL